MLGYEAVTSDFYRYNENYLNNELGTKKKRMSSYLISPYILSMYIVPTTKSPSTAYCFPQQKQGTYLIQLIGQNNSFYNCQDSIMGK